MKITYRGFTNALNTSNTSLPWRSTRRETTPLDFQGPSASTVVGTSGRGVPVGDASGKKRKPALAWTFFCYVRFSGVSSRADSTHHRSVRESAATSSRVKDGWRPSGSLGPRLNPPLRVWCGRPRQPGAPGATRGSFREEKLCCALLLLRSALASPARLAPALCCALLALHSASLLDSQPRIRSSAYQ